MGVRWMGNQTGTVKNLYDIYVMMPRISFQFYRYAYSERQALERAVSEIAKKQGVFKEMVWTYIKEHPKSVEIKIEKEGGLKNVRN